MDMLCAGMRENLGGTMHARVELQVDARWECDCMRLWVLEGNKRVAGLWFALSSHSRNGDN